MKCKICNNESGNSKLILKEMMYGLKDEFEYIKCGNCGCIQIVNIPDDLGKYYPSDYYSYQLEEVPLKRSIIRNIHYHYYAFGKHRFLGSLLAFKFKPSQFYVWLKELGMNNPNERIMDIGCGNGRLLKRIYRLGFNNLTGIDPFMNASVVYNDHIRLLKKNVFEMSGTFDIIMMHHSLEHMDNQQMVIEKVAALLSERGRLLIRIPIVSKPLMEKYGVNVVSLDPPRHLFIHTIKSILSLTEANHLKLYKTVYDAETFSILGSEQYAKGISNVNDERSYIQNPAGSSFTQVDLDCFQKEIDLLNQQGESDSVALYFTK